MMAFLTPVQDIVINLVFRVMNEGRINRTTAEYAAISAKLPPLKVLVYKVNTLLKWMHQRSAETGVPLPWLCRFQAGDQRYSFEPYPVETSIETLRKALEVSGIRAPRGKRAKSF